LVSAPRAVGVRAAYGTIPGHVRAWVDSTLGSPVVEAREQVGGMSPGCATRLVCADGTRAFVKAVGAGLNPHTPVLFRREVLALELLGRHPSWAGLIASYDDDDWVALLLEDVEGSHPDLSLDQEMDRLVEQTDELSATMNARVTSLPPPTPGDGGQALYRPGPTDFATVTRGWVGAFDRLHEVPPDLLPRWVLDRVDPLREQVSMLLDETTDTVVHVDIRNDNLIQRPTGELVFLDWGAFGRGPAWLDPLVARLERVDSPWFDTSLASSPALRAAGDEVVTAWLVGMGTILAWRAHSAVDVNLPTLAAFRRTESARFLGAAARRLGLA
jgi:aminoglycoside phosphotransferase (APT) family kinase protein